MGKGKRLKNQKIEHEATLNKVLQNANEFSMKQLPDYDEATFMEEFERSGYKFDVFRFWMYIKFGVHPDSSSKLVDEAINTAILHHKLEIVDGILKTTE